MTLTTPTRVNRKSFQHKVQTKAQWMSLLELLLYQSLKIIVVDRMDRLKEVAGQVKEESLTVISNKEEAPITRDMASI